MFLMGLLYILDCVLVFNSGTVGSKNCVNQSVFPTAKILVLHSRKQLLNGALKTHQTRHVNFH